MGPLSESKKINAVYRALVLPDETSSELAGGLICVCAMAKAGYFALFCFVLSAILLPLLLYK